MKCFRNLKFESYACRVKERARLIHDDMKSLAELTDAVRDDVK